jgi:hypothetical protein
VIEELGDMFLVRPVTLFQCRAHFPPVQTALRYFHHVNNGHPAKRIIFYRDGVSEGEYAAVEELEIKALSGKKNRLRITNLK